LFVFAVVAILAAVAGFGGLSRCWSWLFEPLLVLCLLDMFIVKRMRCQVQAIQ